MNKDNEISYTISDRDRVLALEKTVEMLIRNNEKVDKIYEEMVKNNIFHEQLKELQDKKDLETEKVNLKIESLEKSILLLQRTIEQDQYKGVRNLDKVERVEAEVQKIQKERAEERAEREKNAVSTKNQKIATFGVIVVALISTITSLLIAILK